MSTTMRSSLSLLLATLLATAAQGQAIPHAGARIADTFAKGWTCFGKNPQHDAVGLVPAQTLNQIHWSAPVDQAPQYSGTALLIHYGSPLVSRHDTIVFPVKTGAFGGFEVQGRNSSNGNLVWSTSTDYVWPPHSWGPSVGITLTPANAVAMPASGGTVLLRASADQAGASVQRLAFYGLANYQANQGAYDANVIIDTPITSDDRANLYFGFFVQGATPLNLVSGIARIAANGSGMWVSAATAAADAGMQKVVYNCAPALSRDGTSLYLAVNDVAGSGFGSGYLLRLDAQTLALQSKVRLKDWAAPANDAYLPDDGTASPAIGPDGDVYFGVLENPFSSNHYRGWMLHFSADLAQTKLAGAFGWDNTASLVPVAAVPSYAGPSPYLLLAKYNHYAGLGDGVNKMAVLDPGVSMIDPVTGANVMNEVLTIAGPTPDTDQLPLYPNAVREWCLNTAAVDTFGSSALVNNEDGKLYRWDFTTNTLSETVVLTAGIGEAYTPTVIGLDGTVYAINNALLFAVGQ